ncbi:MAG: hypothetical protein NTY63_02115 [Candidatus Bipolaricaulota bacterium]|nr:hypothetical protein [Candidatus Bipolaricaulota bacterium]
MDNPRRGACLTAGLCAAAMILLPSISWTTHETADLLHGISSQDLGLVGKVAMVIVETAQLFESTSGPVEGPRRAVETMGFGEDGLLRQWVQYGVPGGLGAVHTYTYEDGFLVEEEIASEAGRVAEETTYVHEDGGKRTTAEVRSGRKQLQKTIVYERDAAGKLLTVSESNAAGTPTSKLVYTYKVGEERADRYDAGGELVSWSIKKLDAKGRPVEVSLYSQGAEDSPFTTTYEYDARGNVTLEETSGQLTLGFVVFTSPPAPTKTSYEYTVDDVGNWTKRVKSIWVSGGKDPHWQETEATYRRIGYYGE